MTKEQQAIYYQEAERQRQLHKQLYPEWSNGDNYVSSVHQDQETKHPAKDPPHSVCVSRVESYIRKREEESPQSPEVHEVKLHPNQILESKLKSKDPFSGTHAEPKPDNC